MTFVASSGDSGAPPEYPSDSPNVLAVGGTTLTLNNGTIANESGWSGSGGGISSYEPQPSYQDNLVIYDGTNLISANDFRTVPDVAYDADPNTGFPVYDSYNNPLSAPWGQWGGTSDAAPQWAALIAIADQGRAVEGLAPLDGPSQTLPALYGLPATDFHDITTGVSSGTPNYTAGSGYDLVTGRGTPVANQIVSGLDARFEVTAPVIVTAGSAITVTLTALDASNDTVTSYAGTIQFTSSDSQAVLPSDVTLTSGVGTFTATLKTAGVQMLTTTDTVLTIMFGSTTIIVAPSVATRFGVSAPPGTTVGVPFTFTVAAQDEFNNPSGLYQGTVQFTSSDTGASVVLPANSTLANGLGTFSATLQTLGTQTLTATDTVTSFITGASKPISVSFAATHFVVSAPASTTAGSAFSFTVTAKDASNNTATGYIGTVEFTSGDSQAVLPVNATLNNGVGIFSATLKTAGTQLLTATDSGVSSISGASSAIAVSAYGSHSFGPQSSTQHDGRCGRFYGYGAGSVQQCRDGLCWDNPLRQQR